MESYSRIKKFIDEVVLPRKGPLPGLPDNFRENPDNGEEWDDWIELPSTVTDADLIAIEVRFEIQLPSLLKSYFKYKIIFDGDFGIYRFPDMMPDRPLENLVAQIEIIEENPFFRENNLFPFAQDGNDGGPICFKYDSEGIKAGFPVYFVDHDLLDQSGYKGEFIFSSFQKLLEAIEDDMRSDGE